MKRTLIALSLAAMALSLSCSLRKRERRYNSSDARTDESRDGSFSVEKAVRNALSGNHIDKLASNPDAKTVSTLISPTG